jgi:hypothetical protein
VLALLLGPCNLNYPEHGFVRFAMIRFDIDCVIRLYYRERTGNRNGSKSVRINTTHLNSLLRRLVCKKKVVSFTEVNRSSSSGKFDWERDAADA